MPRIKLRIAYLGTHFSGWQLQAGSAARTAQGVLEQAISAIAGGEIRLHASGRTDAGVHADGQTAHFDAPVRLAGMNWRRSLNSRLPADISILSAETAPDDFHARFDCKGKTYTYCLWLETGYVPPKIRGFAWALSSSGLVGIRPAGGSEAEDTGLIRLDLAALDKAASLLTGKHDFAAFQNSGSPPGDTVREIVEISRFYLPLPGEMGPRKRENLMALRFTGSGFLKQMVRNLTGFLVYVGIGRLRPEDLEQILLSRDRSFMDVPTAPAWGLTLNDVFY